MTEPDLIIPWDRLPEGFARQLDEPRGPAAVPRPAATIVLLRAGAGGPEVLLLRRVRNAGFVPGAYVFPGGRVDGDDATEALTERVEGVTPAQAAARLGLPGNAEPPALAYYVAAVREAFEETGLLVGTTAGGEAPPSAASDEGVRKLRDQLLADEDAFPAILDALGCRMDARAVAYVAHWITPEAEPRRYDTRFFAAAVPAGRAALLNEAELNHALWLTPEEALLRHGNGRLPMVFPTIKTLESLVGFDAPEAILAHFEDRPIPAILPRLVRTPTGVGLHVPSRD
ncbi:MAG TPA: hypothetical protein VGA70_00495 [Longimicrobiales bacterium]|jgi:8-oxo-dGTP pyrophosphatase MutT (NUDIX family)